VNAAIQQLPAAGDPWVVAPGGGEILAALPVRVCGLHAGQLPDLAGIDRLLHRLRGRHGAVGLAIIEHHTGRLCGGNHRIALRQSLGQRFLTQNMLARSGGGDRNIRMQMVRRADLDRVDIRVGQHRIQAADSPGAYDHLRALRGLFQIEIAADRDPRAIGVALIGADVRLADQPTSHQGHSQKRHCSLFNYCRL
jgi:hypothetical protein